MAELLKSQVVTEKKLCPSPTQTPHDKIERKMSQISRAIDNYVDTDLMVCPFCLRRFYRRRFDWLNHMVNHVLGD